MIFNRKWNEISSEIIENWYRNRALDIEKWGQMPILALQFADTAVNSKGIKNLESIKEDMSMLCSMNYDCDYEIDLKTLLAAKPIDLAAQIMLEVIL